MMKSQTGFPKASLILLLQILLCFAIADNFQTKNTGSVIFPNINNIASYITPQTKDSYYSTASHLSIHRYALEQNYTFKETYLTNSRVATPNYILIGQSNQPQPILKKLVLSTMKIETIKYSVSQNLSGDYYEGGILDMKNGDIALVLGHSLLIINNQTLELKQSIKDDGPGILLLYTDQKTKQTKYLFGSGAETIKNLMSEYNKNQDGKYTAQQKFYAPAPYNLNGIVLAGPQKVIMMKGVCQYEYITNFNSILYSGYYPFFYRKNGFKVTVSNDQTIFVTRNDSHFYEFYSFSNQYEVKLTSNLLINKNDHRKGVFTSDDKYLFISTSSILNKHNIAKVETSTSEFKTISDQFGLSDNQLDFNLFEAKYNRFVSLSVRDTNNYYLQLKSTDNLTLIHQYQINLSFKVLDYKLIGNFQWGLTFALVVRTFQTDYRIQNDAKLILFKVENDKIVQQSISPKDVSFQTLEACYTYIISYKYKFPSIKVYHYSNLSLATQIKQVDSYGSLLMIEKELLLIGRYDYTTVYNLKESLNSKGSYFYPNELQNSIRVIFPKRGLEYDIPKTIILPTEKRVVTVLNISAPTVTSQFSVEGETDCLGISYIKSSDSKSPQCGYFVYLHEGPQIVKYSECTKSKEKYPIKNYPGEQYKVFAASSDSKYVITLLCKYDTDLKNRVCIIEARPLFSLDKIIYHGNQFILIGNYAINAFHLDLVNDNFIILQCPDSMTVIPITPNQDHTSKHSFDELIESSEA